MHTNTDLNVIMETHYFFKKMAEIMDLTVQYLACQVTLLRLTISRLHTIFTRLEVLRQCM